MIETFRFPQPLHTHEPNHYIGWSRRPSRGLALRIEDSKMRRGGVRRAGTHDRERGSRQSGTGRTLMPLGLPGTGRLSPGVMEGARRRGRGKEALMLQSTLFYVLAIGGFANSRCRTRGAALRPDKRFHGFSTVTLSQEPRRRHLHDSSRLRALPSACRSGDKRWLLVGRGPSPHHAAVERAHAQVRPGPHQSGGASAHGRVVFGLRRGVREDHHDGYGAHVGGVRLQRRRLRRERVLRQEHDRRVRLPRHRERGGGAPHAL